MGTDNIFQAPEMICPNPSIEKVESAAEQQNSPESKLMQNEPIFIGNYQMCDYLGYGGFGEVFLGKHIQSKKLVAIKTMKKMTAVYDDQVISRMLVEKRVLQLAKKAKNPFLVGFISSFQTPHHVCLAMDYMAGKDLRFYLSQPLSLQRTG
ncbi:hypothetical protein XENTR_v10012092 [Xenopus tropicalis]|nr:hypothetical protein XENTR_v10012092 [Xenopus tropicalis]